MRRSRLPFSAAAILSALLLCLSPAHEIASRNRPLGIIAGSVCDDRGRPLAGALIVLLREGAETVVQKTRSSSDGTFRLRVLPGRYILRAIADGFNEARFASVEISPSSELIYRFNLEPVGSNRTLPERRADRNEPKWRLRLANGRRSIFNLEEGQSTKVQVAEGEGEPREGLRKEGRTTSGVVETYYAASDAPFTPGFPGLNFAMATPVAQDVALILVGQVAPGAGARFEATARKRVDHHLVSVGLGGAQAKAISADDEGAKAKGEAIGQLSVRAVDEWLVRDGIVVVLGLDYSHFAGAGGLNVFAPRVGLQFDANSRTRIHAAYAPAEREAQTATPLEGGATSFKRFEAQPVALVDGRAVVERSRRFEVGLERVLDERSRIEATAFFDTVDGRGLGLMGVPIAAFANEAGAELIRIANQQGAARGMRVIYTRRISHALSASAGYSFGQGQELAAEGLTNPEKLFRPGFFQTLAAQLDADLGRGTCVRTVFRFSPRATVFAIDPFAGRLAVYDPSLSILVTQELPTFGLPVRAEAVLDARNVLNVLPSADDGETVIFLSSLPRSVRGGISIRF
ncbi:MAG: TonB-dependent receptor [Pyrinomonas methylaliphatogenes]|nr:TonB-dependent receptor [Pyrinomonas methylaliphatogenes]